MEYETIVGLEVHAQLLTASKMFCGCSAQYAAAAPNTNVCPVCLGMPGTLPVINAGAVEKTVLTGLALNCHVAEQTRFDRKNYHYPDLMKGYQISQYDRPLCHDGWLDLELPDGGARRIGIRRVHLEEDTAKLFHRADRGGPYSLVDVNRAGVPLMEIVAEPDIRSPEEAKLYLEKLRLLLRYLGVSTGNMEEGAFRCDANVSIRPVGETQLGVKVEVKNMNSFRAVADALRFEVKRQAEVIESGGSIHQETRGWVETRGVTIGQRSKEFAHDYRYFPEPDLPPLELARDWVDDVRGRMPELPEAKRERLVATVGLTPYLAGVITGEMELADYFERAAEHFPDALKVANLIVTDLRSLLNASGQSLADTKVRPVHLAELLRLLDDGQLNTTTVKQVLACTFETGAAPADIVAELGIRQVSDESQLSAIVDRAIIDSSKAVADYKGGKVQAVNAIVGAVMKATKGQANQAVVRQLIVAKLDG